MNKNNNDNYGKIRKCNYSYYIKYLNIMDLIVYSAKLDNKNTSIVMPNLFSIANNEMKL